MTTQFLSPALHKNFSEADFDFKVCLVSDPPPPCYTCVLYVRQHGLTLLLGARQVWNSFFSLTVLYINQPSLQLEALGPAKRKKVLDK